MFKKIILIIVLLLGGCSKKEEIKPDGKVTATIVSTEKTRQSSVTYFYANEAEGSYLLTDKDIVVANDGNDLNKGTIEEPLKSLQVALDKAVAGSHIYLRGGVYTGSFVFKSSGTAKDKIVLSSYNGEDVLISGSKNTRVILDLNGQSYLKITGLRIGEYTGKDLYGILLHDGEHHVEISNNEFMKLQGIDHANPILCFGDDTNSIHDILITNNYFHDNKTGTSECLSVASNCERIEVSYNVIANNGNIGIDFYGNGGYNLAGLDQARDSSIHHNKVYGNKSALATCAGIYLDGAKNIDVYENEVFSNMYGIEVGAENNVDNYPTTNIKLTNNLIYDNPNGGIMIGGYTKDKQSGNVTKVKVSKNTLKDNGGFGEICLMKVDGVAIEDNTLSKINDDSSFINVLMSSSYTKNLNFKNNVYEYLRQAIFLKEDESLEFEDFCEMYKCMDSLKAASN